MENDMSSSDTTRAPMKVRQAFLYYLGAWAAWVVVVMLVWLVSRFDVRGFTLFLLYMAGYLGIGVALNRTVLMRLIEWHPMYDTLGNVSSSKLRMIFFWPFTYFFLFIRLGIVKYL